MADIRKEMKRRDSITPKSSLKLRKIGSKYMIVEASGSCVNLTNVYSMNETAALLWETLCKDGEHSTEELAEVLCKAYEVDYERALHDVKHQLNEWETMGLIG